MHGFTFKLTSMPVFFRRPTLGWPDPIEPPEDWDGAYKIFTVCGTKDPRSCFARADRLALSIGDRKSAQTQLMQLVLRGNQGQPLHTLYHGSQLHPGHEFTRRPHDKDPIKVSLIRNGAVRVYFIYLERKIVLLRTWAKRKDELSLQETLELERLTRDVLDTCDAYGFENRLI